MTDRTTLTSEDINFAGRGYPVDREKDSSLPYGINANRFTYTEIDLSVARANAEVNISGNVLGVFGSSSALAWAEIRLDEYGSSGVIARDGLIIQGVPFRKLWLTHRAQPGLKMRVLHGVDPQVRFSLQAPPMITPWMANTAGMGFRSSIAVNANVSNTSCISYVNPVGSGVIGVFYRLNCNSDYRVVRCSDPTTLTNSSDVSVNFTNVSHLGAGTTNGYTSTSELKAYTGNAPTRLDNALYDGVAINGIVDSMNFEIPILLGEGDHFVVESNGVNNGIRAMCWHYELPKELFS